MRTGSRPLAAMLVMSTWFIWSALAPAVARADDVEAGPIWNQAHAQTRCPAVCQPRRWTGEWRTTRQGQMSVCQCEGPAPAPPRYGDVWRELPQRAVDIGVGANGAVWAVSRYGVSHWSGTAWAEVGGSGERVAVGPDGQPWMVDRKNAIYQRVGTYWNKMPGRGQDIGVGADGTVWMLGTKASIDGYAIYFWNNGRWIQVDGAATRIAVGPDGSPYVVNRAGNIYHRVDDTWQQLPGQASDIGVGADGTVWIIGTNPVPGGFGIYYLDGTHFQAIDGGATNISVGPNGMPWVTNSDNRIYVREVAPPPPPPPAPPPLHRGRGAIVSSNGKCLDAEGGDFDARNNGGRVWSYDCHGGPNQQWRLDSGVIIAGNGKCLEVHGEDFNRRNNGGRVQLWDCHGGPNQQWSYNGSAIVSASGKCLDLHGPDFDARVNRGRVQVWDCHGGPNQQWAAKRHRGWLSGPPPDSASSYPPPPPPPPPVVLPMAPERFDQMFRAVRSLASIDERLNRIKDYLTPETYFTTQQIAQLMQLTTFASERLRVAVLLWPRVVDPDRFPDLVTLFSFESERQELRRQLGR